MKRSEAILAISKKLQKSIHLMKSERELNNPKMLCDNLALRVMVEIEKLGMLPPPHFGDLPKVAGNDVFLSWEKEEEE